MRSDLALAQGERVVDEQVGEALDARDRSSPRYTRRQRRQHGVEQTVRAETDRVVGRAGRSPPRRRRSAPGRRPRRAGPVLRATAATRAGPHGQREALVQARPAPEAGGSGGPGTPSSSVVAGPVDEDENVRRAAVVEAERDAGELRVDDRPLAFDEEQVAPARRPRRRASPPRRRGSRRRRRPRRFPSRRS